MTTVEKWRAPHQLRAGDWLVWKQGTVRLVVTVRRIRQVWIWLSDGRLVRTQPGVLMRVRRETKP